MLEKNRIYEYKGRQYSIMGNAIMLDETSGFEDKIESVIYYALNEDGTIDRSEKFIRSCQDFIENFKPIALWVGDEVIGVSMGKIVEVLKIVDVEDVIAKCESITFSRVIAANGSVKPISNSNKDNTIEYYFASEVLKRQLMRRKEISNLIKRIKDALDKLDDSHHPNFSIQELATKTLDIENFVANAQ